ncbi:MAG: TetR/AcrR family transcriptional regulator [Acidimicrobiales bacterium]
MQRTRDPTSILQLAARYSVTQRRTLNVAHALFAQHGVGGTSLQMIADALGVTKAAVYHQFQTKDAIVRAVIEVQLEPIEAMLERLGPCTATQAMREKLLDGLLDVVVANRSALSTLQSDPVLFRLLVEYPPSFRLWTRVFDVLLDGEVGDRALVRSAVLSAALGTVGYPFVEDIDDDVLRAELQRMMHALVFDLL